ncbi:hypothetical protein CPB83DRAFT_908622 [Crepidotus variabilis]|uniref:Uncharacterized protein n=1 Tax=Crepidotus variabilis TaxID=179855 RepID=A0A9P6JMW5_9AGAR|nr:hypothetical protein CPB83DRAFT_908622 [Crepidotus variabilis]
MAQKRAYMVVTPRPRFTNTLNVRNTAGVNENCFYVKFGDGDYRPAYKTHNPNIEGEVCDEAGLTKTSVPDENNIPRLKWAGKALEWTYLDRVPGDESEWHKVTPIAPYTYAQLRTDLAHLLDTFDMITLDPNSNNTNPRWAATLTWENDAINLFKPLVKKVTIV